ncbi:phosphatase PAP2 family protein [Tahibacter amnicola]|uniref:undecaprenyl-diphosphate phosphatase n=1 Tax=Tahibacter amnicola TaxID=2976241 RepID=A0ABY6BI27_9GAMM|nr:phosphatase PAP2 family protein [Tahibacter amnicola]UXI69444.1 phosphatase PAP2 family protein [Tahibacter amnicola]
MDNSADAPSQGRRLWRWSRWQVIGIAALALLALAISSLFADDGAHTLDRGLMLALRTPGTTDDPLGPKWFEDVMRDMTALGGIGVVIGSTLVLCGWFMLRRRLGDIAILAGSLVGAQVLSAIAKFFISRPRPDLVSYEAEIYSASFPSGHTLMATVAYVTFAMLLAADVGDRRSREFLLGVAWVAAIAVGVSRIYLGVHWPSDVLAGWAIGALWMIAMSRLIPRLQWRHG